MKKIYLLLILTFNCYISNAQFCPNKVNITGTQSVCLNYGSYFYSFQLDQNSNIWPQDPVTGKAGFQYKVSVTGGQIIKVNGNSVGPTTNYTIDYKGDPAVFNNQNSVEIRWGNYDSNGNLVTNPYQQPTSGNISIDADQIGKPCPFYSCFECGNVSSGNFGITVQNQDVTTPLSGINTNLPVTNLQGTYQILNDVGGTQTVVDPSVIYLGCVNYGGSFGVNIIENATYSWYIDGLSTPLGGGYAFSTTNSAQIGEFFPHPYNVPNGVLASNQIYAPNFINLSVYRPCVGTQSQTIYVVLSPNPNIAIPTFNSNIGANAQTLVPICGVNNYQLNLPYISGIASYTIDAIPTGWTFTHNNLTIKSGQSISADGSPIFLSYNNSTSPNPVAQAGTFNIIINQGCGATKKVLYTLTGISRFIENITSSFTEGCTGNNITFNASVIGNNGNYKPYNSSSYWTDNSGTSPSVSINTNSTYQLVFTQGAKSFVTYSNLIDSKNCVATGGRVYYAIGGGSNNAGWSSGQLATINVPINSQLALGATSQNIYFTDTQGHLETYSYNTTSQSWVESYPLAFSAQTSGNNNPVQVDENIAVPGQTYVYYENNTNGISVYNNHITQTIFGGQVKSGSNIAIDNSSGTVYLIDNTGTIWSYSPKTGGSAVSTGITGVTGAVAVSNGRIFYASNGTLYYRTIGSTASVQVTNATGSLGIENSSNITFDSRGDLYYSSYNDIGFVRINSIGIQPAVGLFNILGLTPSSGPAGPIVINTNSTSLSASSDNIYYTGYDGRIYVVNPLFTTPKIEPSTNYNDGAANSGNLVFGTQNVYYVSSGGYISNLFGKTCTSLFREEAPTSLDEWLKEFDQRTAPAKPSLTFVPNPTTGSVAFKYQSNSVGSRKLLIYNLQGQEEIKIIFSDEISSNLQSELDVSKLASGVYIAVLFENEKAAANSRLVVK